MGIGRTSVCNKHLGELEQDQKRLEWCASNQAEFYRDDPYWIIRWCNPTGEWCEDQESSMADNWRDAIDKAMNRG
jgi:hypothetical protein